MRKIILASHGEFAKGLLDSARMVVGGAADHVTAYSMYPGDSAEDYAKEIEGEILLNSQTEYVIIADLFGASVCSAMTSLTRYKNVALFTGLSFSMLLELLTSFSEPLEKDDIEQLVQVSREGIRYVNIEDASEEMEDF